MPNCVDEFREKILLESGRDDERGSQKKKSETPSEEPLSVLDQQVILKKIVQLKEICITDVNKKEQFQKKRLVDSHALNNLEQTIKALSEKGKKRDLYMVHVMQETKNIAQANINKNASNLQK